MARAPKVEHARLITLLYMLALLDGDVTSADLIHANANKRHESNLGIIRLDDDDGPRGQRRQVTLRNANARRVNLRHVWIANALKQRLAEVGALLYESTPHHARHGRVPAVVRQRRQKRLVDGAACKLRRQLVVRQHVDDRVRLALDEEVVAQLDVARHVEHLGLARVGNDVVVFRRGQWSGTFAECAGEEVYIHCVSRQ